jgi:hypothetical protein
MVLNSFVFWHFWLVFDHKLEIGCSPKKMKSAPVGTMIYDDS